MNLIEFEACELLSETPMARLIYDGAAEIWIPISQMKGIEEYNQDGKEYIDFSIPEWLALEKGMI